MTTRASVRAWTRTCTHDGASSRPGGGPGGASAHARARSWTTAHHGSRDDRCADDVHRPRGETRQEKGHQGAPRHAPEEDESEPETSHADRVPDGGSGERAGGDDGGVEVSGTDGGRECVEEGSARASKRVVVDVDVDDVDGTRRAAIGFRAPSRAHARGRRRREKREGLAIKHSIDFFSEFVVLSMFLRTYFGVREPLVRWIAGAGG